MTTEEIALRLLEAQLQGGKPLAEVNVREAFAVAISFEAEAKTVRSSGREPHSRLAYDDNGL